MRTKLKVKSAESMNNGILFHSNYHKGYIAISTIDEFNNIKTEWTTMKQYRKHGKLYAVKEFFMQLLYNLSFAILFVIFVNWIWNQNPILGFRILLLGVALFRLSKLLLLSTNTTRKQLKKFHSAVHMVINAYNSLKRVPSLEEIRKYSRFSNSCSTNCTGLIVMHFFALFLCSFIGNPLYMQIAMICSLWIVFVLSNYGVFNFFQNFTTLRPTDKELKVAIAGMTVWLENEAKERTI